MGFCEASRNELLSEMANLQERLSWKPQLTLPALSFPNFNLDQDCHSQSWKVEKSKVAKAETILVCLTLSRQADAESIRRQVELEADIKQREESCEHKLQFLSFSQFLQSFRTWQLQLKLTCLGYWYAFKCTGGNSSYDQCLSTIHLACARTGLLSSRLKRSPWWKTWSADVG